MNDPQKCQVARYKHIIDDLNKRLVEFKLTSDMEACAMNKNALDYYMKVFAWLQTQEWYQNHAHEVRKYTESIVDIQPPVIY